MNHILCWLLTMILYTIYISTVNLSLSLSLFSLTHVQDAKGFATCLLDFIGSNAQYLVSLMKMTSSDVDTSEQGQKDRLKHVEMTLETLYHVIHNNPEVEMPFSFCSLPPSLPLLLFPLLLFPLDSHELIWNDEAREKVSGVVAKITKE